MRATPTHDGSSPRSANSRSAGPFTAAPAISGLTATTRSRAATSASRTPGTARIGPIESTGLAGQITIVSAPSIASSTPGAGRAVSAPSNRTSSTGGSHRSRTNHSSIASSTTPDSVDAVIRVGTRSSVIGSRRQGSSHAAAISAVTADSVAPARSRSVRNRCVARSLSPRPNQVSTP